MSLPASGPDRGLHRQHSSKVRFSVEVERESVERERRSTSSLLKDSAGDVVETIHLDFGLIKHNHVYETVAANGLRPGSTISQVQSPNNVNIEIAGPSLKVRLQATTHGTISEVASVQVHDSDHVNRSLQLQISGNCMLESQGTPVLRSNVHCVSSSSSGEMRVSLGSTVIPADEV